MDSSPKLTSVPLTGFASTNEAIAAHLRDCAQSVEDGHWGDLRNIFIVMEPVEGNLIRQTCGAPCDLARAIGILQIAIIRASVG